MKLLVLNTFDHHGGAAIATYRIHRGLKSIGIDSHLLVQEKKTDDSSVIGPRGKFQKMAAIVRPYLETMTEKISRSKRAGLFSSAWIPDNLESRINLINPDIVHLFWVNYGFLRIETIKKFDRPIVWTLHDMWPFTGGCHYDGGCGKFDRSCGKCPVLGSEHERDLSRRVLQRKQKAWKDVPLVVVATSQWLADMARASTLFRDKQIEVIPNGIDIEKYKPANKEAARSVYNLPQDKWLVLFSAFSATSDRRKGNHLLVQALRKMCLSGLGAKIELVIVGASRPEDPPDLGMKVHYIGHLHDELSQVLLYSAADVLVAPSMQENLSNTVMESLACGTPVVAFDIGGMPDMIDHQESGYLASPFDPEALADGIGWVLEDEERRVALGHRARQTVVERYTLENVAKRYSNLYQSLLN